MTKPVEEIKIVRDYLWDRHKELVEKKDRTQKDDVNGIIYEGMIDFLDQLMGIQNTI